MSSTTSVTATVLEPSPSRGDAPKILVMPSASVHGEGGGGEGGGGGGLGGCIGGKGGEGEGGGEGGLGGGAGLGGSPGGSYIWHDSMCGASPMPFHHDSS